MAGVGIPINVDITSGPVTTANAFYISIQLDDVVTVDTPILVTASDVTAITPINGVFPLTLTVPAGHDSVDYWLTANATGQYRIIAAPDGSDLDDSDDWTALCTVPVNS